MQDAIATDIWESGLPGPGELALALDEDEATVQALVGLLGSQGAAGRFPDCEFGRLRLDERAAIAILHVLSCRARIAPQPMAAALGHWPQVPASVSRFLEFRPLPDGGEVDPFLFFSPFAAESMPLPAVDEYVDVVEDRFVLWRRPAADPTPLALALGGGGEGLDYLDALQRLKAAPAYETVCLGFIDGESFHPRTQTAGEPLDCEAGPAAPQEGYAHRISVNVSLAARQMKRRALGLQVIS